MSPRPYRTSAVLLSAALLLSACGSGGGDASGEFNLVSAGTLTACSDVPYPPFEIEDADSPSGYSGFDIDLLQAIADGLELDLAVEDVSFDALQSGTVLAANQCDLGASAMTITPERAENLDFSDPYYDSLQSLLAPADSGIASIDDLAGKTVGVQAGTTGLNFTEENAPEGTEIVEYPSDGELWPALQAGQIDAILQDLPVNLEHAAADDSYVIVEEYPTDEQYGFALAKGERPALLEAINTQLAELRENGEYDRIYDSYFSTDAA